MQAPNLNGRRKDPALHKIPLLYAVQTQEDFVGKPSRLSRRVSPRSVLQSVLQRAPSNGPVVRSPRPGCRPPGGGLAS